MRGEGDEDKHDWDEEAGGDPGDRLTDGVELDPAQDGDLDEEHEDSEDRGEAPGELHDQVHLHVRRLEHGLLGLKRDVKSKQCVPDIRSTNIRSSRLKGQFWCRPK